MDQKLSLLATVPLLAGLSRKELEAVGALCDEVDLPAGRVIARQGTTADAFYVIVDGTIGIDRNGEHVRDLGAGTFFGELALLGDIPRTATATSTTACRLLVIGHREFHALLADFPSIQSSILTGAAKRMAQLEPDRAP